MLDSFDVKLVRTDDPQTWDKQRRVLDPDDGMALRALLRELGVSLGGRNKYAPRSWEGDYQLHIFWAGKEQGPGMQAGPLVFGGGDGT